MDIICCMVVSLMDELIMNGRRDRVKVLQQWRQPIIWSLFRKNHIKMKQTGSGVVVVGEGHNKSANDLH